MVGSDGYRLGLSAVFALAAATAAAVAAGPVLDLGGQQCIERLRDAGLQEQLLCLHRLRESPPGAISATQTLSDILARADGTTDDVLVAAVLDVFRAMQHGAAPARETVSRLLSHGCKLYRDRDKMVVLRMRAYILNTLGEIGFPSSALPTLLESLANVDEQMMAIEVGAAARVVRSLRHRDGHQFIPYLIDTLPLRLSEEEFSLERYDVQFPKEEATTVQLEAVRSLGWVCSPNDANAVAVLRRLAVHREGDGRDPRLAREARDALERIHAGPGVGDESAA